MSIVEAEQQKAPVSVRVNVGSGEITFETGKLAKQADGAVVVRSGDTMVLATAQGRTEGREGADFFPLTVDVEERMYAAGKIPGGFFKREGRQGEKAILTARMIDRPIRPLWPKGYRNEVQCIVTVLSADMVVPHDILAINGVSAALMLSPMPFLGPIGAVRVGLIEGELVINPTLQETEEGSELDLIVERHGAAAVERHVREQFEGDLRGLTDAEQDSKELKSAKQHLLFERIIETVNLPFPVGPATVDGEPAVKDSLTKSYVKKATESVYKDLVRKKIAIDKRRPDGRSEEQIRPVSCEVTVSPRTHASGLFTRGQTQIMSLCTLGTAKEGQRIDDLSLEGERRYMHHYNFPPFSVGETGMLRGPKRRDIGHGALAQRALEAVIPPTSEFPYTIRIVSETLESNGSSSMGSVCGSTLALMDAGVPIKAPVSGIAMGLVMEGDDYVIRTDIQGAEDQLGDMDFKVAGSRTGVTALQMDIKITGVTQEILRNA